jgi:hypothetical protein
LNGRYDYEFQVLISKKTQLAVTKPKFGWTERDNVGKTQAGGPRFETGTLGCKSKMHSREWCVWKIFVMCRSLLRGNEVTGEWRKLHNEELNDLYSSPNTVGVINSRRMRYVGHVAHMGERRGLYRVWWENQKERDHLGDPDLGGRIILR